MFKSRKMQTVARIVLLAIAMLKSCYGYPTGPPVNDRAELCRTMLPGHGADPQNSTSPFSIETDATCYTPAQNLIVTLSTSSSNQPFQGFFMQARKPNDDNFSYGTFDNLNDPTIHTLDCFNQSSNAIAHYNTNHSRFTTETFRWTAPANVDDGLDVIEFVATVVESKMVFWVGLRHRVERCSRSRSINSSSNSSNSNNSSDVTSSEMTNVSSATPGPTAETSPLLNTTSNAVFNVTETSPLLNTTSNDVFNVTEVTTVRLPKVTTTSNNTTETAFITTDNSSIPEMTTTYTYNHTTSEANRLISFTLWSTAAAFCFKLIVH